MTWLPDSASFQTMESSWFSRAPSSRHALLADSRHELPRWRSPSPMAASLIPPPIVLSTYPTSPRTVIKSAIIEKPTPLDDRQRDIEADLQFLLDAQAEELERGRRGGIPDDQTSTGSTTPTQSVRSASTRKTSKPARLKLGLKSARKGIYNSIVALSAVKSEELQNIDAELHIKDDALAQIDGWEQKRRGLQEARDTVDENEDTVRVQRLRQEADVLQEGINQVELQLSDMKSRQRKLLKKAEAVENNVQAKLATYTSSLSMLEAEVQKFLSSRHADAAARPLSPDGKASVWQLPPRRRTLDMARAQYAEDREAVLQERQDIERENEALKDGAVMWKEIVSQVSDFEKRMRSEMSNLANVSGSASAWEDPPRQPDSQDRLRDLLVQLGPVLESLESKHKLTEENDWKLLIAAIGAELDALRQGKAILESLLGVKPAFEEELVNAHDDAGAESDDGSVNAIQELDESFETARPLRRLSTGTSSSDDDGPGPELMFSRRNIDEEEAS